MLAPKTPKDIQVFNGMAQFYRCFIKNFSFIMAPITRFLCKMEVFEWTIECQEVWDTINQQYLDAPILITLEWNMHGIHVHTNASNLAIGAMLPQNLVGKCDQPIAYASKLLNNVKKNYTTTKRGALVMVCALHKF